MLDSMTKSLFNKLERRIIKLTPDFDDTLK
jgi:hypothetical protein